MIPKSSLGRDVMAQPHFTDGGCKSVQSTHCTTVNPFEMFTTWADGIDGMVCEKQSQEWTLILR